MLSNYLMNTWMNKNGFIPFLVLRIHSFGNPGNYLRKLFSNQIWGPWRKEQHLEFSGNFSFKMYGYNPMSVRLDFRCLQYYLAVHWHYSQSPSVHYKITPYYFIMAALLFQVPTSGFVINYWVKHYLRVYFGLKHLWYNRKYICLVSVPSSWYIAPKTLGISGEIRMSFIC